MRYRRSCVGPGDRGNQWMAQVDLQDRPGLGRAIMLRQQALQFAVGPMTAGDETGCAGGQLRRGPHIADALAEAGLDDCDRRGFVGSGLRLVLCTLVEQWDQVEVDIALAERLQRLAFEIEPRRGP